MSFPDPAQQPPLPPFLPVPFAGGDVDRFWPTPLMNDAVSQFEHPPLSKQPMNFENNPSNFAPFAQMKSQDEITKSSETKGTSHIVYKTRICAKFTEGNCRNGEHCTYAHGIEDLRNPPPNWQELVRGKKRGVENFSDDQRMIQRMKICKSFYDGHECRYGEKCKFLHERPMKFMTHSSRQKRDSVVESIGATRSDLINKRDYAQHDYGKNVSSSSDTFQVKTALWKTKLGCKWEIGQCPSGETCHFAHDQSDLHLPLARVETERVMNSGCKIPEEPLLVPVICSSHETTVVLAPANEDAERKKWKIDRQVKGIYADWLDDFWPPHNSPGNEEI